MAFVLKPTLDHELKKGCCKNRRGPPLASGERLCVVTRNLGKEFPYIVIDLVSHAAECV